VIGLYSQRVETLAKAYRAAKRNNAAFHEATSNVAKYTQQLRYIRNLKGSLRLFSGIVVEQEGDWQAKVLRMLEAQIMEYLYYVYPMDGYKVDLSTRIVRGKVHVEGEVRSQFLGSLTGDVADTQGRLFQQVVSFAALIAIMKILGVDSVYIDEAFSGASKANVAKINKLLQHVQEEGLNVTLIAQDTTMAENIKSNVLILTRSVDNKTTVVQREVESNV